MLRHYKITSLDRRLNGRCEKPITDFARLWDRLPMTSHARDLAQKIHAKAQLGVCQEGRACRRFDDFAVRIAFRLPASSLKASSSFCALPAYSASMITNAAIGPGSAIPAARSHKGIQ